MARSKDAAPKRPRRPAKKAGKKKAAAGNGNGATLGFEQKLWQAADKLRNNLDAAEYKHVVLGLIFLKYISDAFEEKHAVLEAERQAGADPEDPDEYRAENIFWVPREARWPHLQGKAKQPAIGKLVDDAMVAIERDNPTLKGVLPKNYARPALDKQRLGELIDLVSTLGLGDQENRARDLLGRVYEYFLSSFASAEGKKGGQFYTPQCVVRVLVEMLAPFKGRVYDPCCGSGGMFVQSEKFALAHGGRIGDISIYGQESNPTTWRLAKMNLAIRGIDANLGAQWGDTFHGDQHKDLKADYVLANPPFNDSDWGGSRLREYVRELAGKCDSRLASDDLDGAVTVARTLLEAILSELETRLAGAKGKYKGDLPRQFKQVTRLLRMDEQRTDLNDRFKDVIRGLVMVANGLAPLRNKMSDGHARERKPAPHHARVVVNAAKTVSAFLVESYTYQIGKGLIQDLASTNKEVSA